MAGFYFTPNRQGALAADLDGPRWKGRPRGHASPTHLLCRYDVRCVRRSTCIPHASRRAAEQRPTNACFACVRSLVEEAPLPMRWAQGSLRGSRCGCASTISQAPRDMLVRRPTTAPRTCHDRAKALGATAATRGAAHTARCFTTTGVSRGGDPPLGADGQQCART